MKLHYFLYFLIGGVSADLTENRKISEGTLQKLRKKYEPPYKTNNVHDGGSNTFQNTFKDIDNGTYRISVISEIVRNVTEQINRFRSTEETKFPLDVIPLVFIPNPTQKFQERAKSYQNQHVQNHTQNNVNYAVQEIMLIYPNQDLHESKQKDNKFDVEEQVLNGSTKNLLRVIHLGFIPRPLRPAKINVLQSLLKTNHKRPGPLHGIHNAWKFTELYSVKDHRDFIQSGITHDLVKSVKLQLDRNLQKPVNLTDDFPKLVKFTSVHEYHSHKKNHNNGIKSREIPKIQEPKVRLLGKTGNGNLTDSPRNAFHLNISHNHKKREIFSKVKKNDATQRFPNTETSIDIDQNDQQNDFGTPNEVDETRDVRKFRTREPRDSIQFTPDNITKELSEFMPTTIQRKKTKGFPRHFLTKPVRVNQDYLPQKPVQLDVSHRIRKSVQVNPFQNMRGPIKLHPTFNLRKPVQLDPTHDMRRPVQLHPSHDLRQPVKLEPTHNLRKPVKLMESHDLRWPVLEESDHHMRNPITDADKFRSEDADGELKEFIKGQLRKGSKTSFIDDPFHELLYEDEFLFLKCSQNQVNSNNTTFSFGTNPESAAIRSVTKYNKSFNESIKACGVPFNHSTDTRREAKLTKWPWMVSLKQYIFNRFWHKCAGSLLNNLWVITAAHCVESRPKWDFLLQLGMNEDLRNYIERFVSRMSIHPKFNSLSLDHDIALLRMDAPVAFQTSIVPICLPWKPDEIEKKKAVALAWRLANEKHDSDDLSREKTVPVLTNKECEVMFSETGSSESIQKSFLCASFENGDQDSCVGDSGGPLVIFDDNNRWILAGIYSWGKLCRTPNQPEVYIRISRYSEWIEKTILCYEENINLHRMD